MTDKYFMEAPIDQQLWENIPEELDSSSLCTCNICNSTLVKEDYFDEGASTCKLCVYKVKNKQGILDIDYKVLSVFTSIELESYRTEFKTYLDTLDIDLETYLALYSSFRNFLRYVWYHLGLPEPTEAQLFFCDYLQYNDDHTIINAFRGIGKSWITSVFVAWKLWRDNTLKILVVSASKERADSFSIFTKRLFEEIPVLNELIPRGERTSNKAFDIGSIPPAHAPSVKSAGITGQITGSRADLIIADDVEVIDNSATEDARLKLIEKCKDFVSILVPNTSSKKSRILYLGTPQTEESIYDKLSDMGYKKFIIPARYPENIAKYKGYLAKYITDKMRLDPNLVGKPTDPQRFDENDLATREALIGKSTFQLQFQLDTELSDAMKYPLRTSDFIVTNLEPTRVASYIAYSSNKASIIRDFVNLGFSGDKLYEAGYIEEPYVPYTQVGLFIDPAGTGTDETGWAVIAHFAGRLYVLDYGGLTGTGYSDENLLYLAKKARDFKCSVVLIEDNFGDGMYSKMLEPYIRRLHGACKMESMKNSTQKERRIIDTLEPLLNQHRLVFNKTSIQNELDWVLSDKAKNTKYSLLYQLTHISKDKGSLKNDDRLDALAIGVKYWEDVLNRDILKMAVEAKNKRLADEIKRLTELNKILFPTIDTKKETAMDKLRSRGGRRANKRSYR